MFIYRDSINEPTVSGEASSWQKLILEQREIPKIKYWNKTSLSECEEGLKLFSHLPLYTLCDGAGGDPLGLMTVQKYRDVSTKPNLSDISKYLYIAHPFLSHYCDIGRKLLKTLHAADYSHSIETTDFNLFHFLCGARYSFTQIHNHATATALLFEGMKEWWLAPPTASNAQTLQPLFLDRIRHLYLGSANSFEDWLDNKRDEVSLIDDLSIVIQPAGTSLYIPNKWYHGVINHSFSRSITLSWDYKDI